MRKYFLVLVTIFALCLFTGLAVAQSQSSTSPNSETQGTIHNGQATNPGDASKSTTDPAVSGSTESTSSSTAAQQASPSSTSSSDQAGQSSSSSVGSQPSSSSSTGVQNDQSNSSTTSSTPNSTASAGSDMAANSGSQKTLEGCLVKENTDYFIQPVSGEREKLNSTEDLSSKVNKQVRVEGTEQDSMASNSTSLPSTSANSSAGTGSAETQNNSAGSIAGNAGSSNATGTAASASPSSSNAKEFQVTKIETVSESCPAGSSK